VTDNDCLSPRLGFMGGVLHTRTDAQRGC